MTTPLLDDRTAGYVQLIRKLFSGRSDIYATWIATGRAAQVKEPLTDAVIASHVAGDRGAGIGVYPMLKDGERWLCRWGCVDIDRDGKPEESTPVALAIAQVAAVKYELNLHVERTKSGDCHLWLFLAESVDCWKVRALLQLVVETAGEKVGTERKDREIRLFPMETAPSDGVLVFIPWFGTNARRGRQVFLDPNTGTVLPDQLDGMAHATQHPAKLINDLVEMNDLKGAGDIRRIGPGQPFAVADAPKAEAGSLRALAEPEFRDLTRKLRALRMLVERPAAATYQDWIAGLTHLVPFADGMERARGLSQLDAGRYTEAAFLGQWSACVRMYGQASVQRDARISQRLVGLWRGQGREDIVPISSRYCLYSGGFAYRSYDRVDGVMLEKAPERFTNFIAEIASEEVVDDGAGESQAMFRLEGRLDSGESLPTVEIPTADWAKVVEWLPKTWGFKPIIYQGRNTKASFLEALALAGQEAPTVKVFTHTGWTTTKTGQRVFLLPQGPYGPPALREAFSAGCRLRIPPELAPYELPDGVNKTQAEWGFDALERFLEMGDLRVTAPLVGSLFLAPLHSLLPIDFGVFLSGMTGTHKSSLAALALSFWGKGFSRQTLPASFRHTANYVETIGHHAKDLPLVVDNYIPTQKGEQQEILRKLAHLIGERTHRGRLDSHARMRRSRGIRALCILTGEDLPAGHSDTARFFIAPVMYDSLKLAEMADLQAMGARGELTPVMGWYLDWLTRHLDEGMLATIAARYQQELVWARNQPRAHDRMCEQAAWIRVGIWLAVQAHPAGKWTRGHLAPSIDSALVTANEARNVVTREASLAFRFLSGIMYLVHQGTIRMGDMRRGDPPGHGAELFGFKHVGGHWIALNDRAQVELWYEPANVAAGDPPGGWYFYVLPEMVTRIRESLKMTQPFAESPRAVAHALLNDRLMAGGGDNRASLFGAGRMRAWRIHGPSALDLLGIAQEQE